VGARFWRRERDRRRGNGAQRAASPQYVERSRRTQCASIASRHGSSIGGKFLVQRLHRLEQGNQPSLVPWHDHQTIAVTFMIAS
jgi:hypothetical protein